MSESSEKNGARADPQSLEPQSSSAMDNDVNALDFLIALGEEKKVLFIIPLVASVLAAAVSYFLPIEFTATTTFLPPQQQQTMAAAALQQLGGLAGIAGVAAGVKRPDDLYIAILRSPTLQDAVIERLDLMKRYEVKLKQDARRFLAESVAISSDRSGLLKLEATDRDPAFSAQMANEHVEALRKLLGSLAVTEAQQRRVFFEGQLVGAKEGLIKAEIALKLTQERTGLIALDKQGEAIIKTVAELRAQIVAYEVQLQALHTFATAENPDARRLATEISALKAQLARIEAGHVRGQGEVIVPTGKVPETGLEYIRALREVKYHEAIFELLARQFELAKVDEAREGPLLQQVDVATPPERRSRPHRRLIVFLAAAIAFFVSVVIALFRVSLRRAGKQSELARKIQLLRSAWRIRGRT